MSWIVGVINAVNLAIKSSTQQQPIKNDIETLGLFTERLAL
jgi:hypothetical protein